MKLSLGFSPCPNDTFIFDALVNKKIDTGNLEFEAVLEDVQTLNQWAAEGNVDITKLSFPAFFRNRDKYILLNSGAALGRGVGPLLISKFQVTNSKFQNTAVALPGENTTAHFLFSFAYPEAENKKFMIFSAIEDAVLNEETELGVIIHENRFTYAQRGLKKIMDLGEYWEEKMKVPVPLGGIAIRNTIEKSIALKVQHLIKQSIEYAWSAYPELSGYIKHHAQEMDEEIMRKHIELYVNDFSLSLKEEGKQAIECLEKVYCQLENCQEHDTLSGKLFLS